MHPWHPLWLGPCLSNLSIWERNRKRLYVHYCSQACISTFPELVISQRNLSENRKYALACIYDKFRESVEMALIIIFKLD